MSTDQTRKDNNEAKDLQCLQKAVAEKESMTNGKRDLKDSSLQGDLNRVCKEKDTTGDQCEQDHRFLDSRKNGVSQKTGLAEVKKNSNKSCHVQNESTPKCTNGQTLGQRSIEESTKEDSQHNGLSKGSITEGAQQNDLTTVTTLMEGVNLELIRSVTPLRCLQMSKLKKAIMKSLESIEHPICEVSLEGDDKVSGIGLNVLFNSLGHIETGV